MLLFDFLYFSLLIFIQNPLTNTLSCYDRPQQCHSVQNPCTLAPTCTVAPAAVCHPDYCMAVCGSTRYFMSNPKLTGEAAIHGCPTVSVNHGSAVPGGYNPVGGAAWPQTGLPQTGLPQTGLHHQPYQPRYTGPYTGPYAGQYSVYQNNPGYHGYPVYPGYPPQALPTRTCDDMISDVLGPAAGGQVVVGRKKRESEQELSRVRRMLFERNNMPIATEATIVVNPDQNLECNNTGCFVLMKGDGEGSSGKTLLQSSRWHQTHKLAFLRSCDEQIYTTQCQYGQRCCRIQSVFNKYFCVGKPTQPYGNFNPTQQSPPVFISANAPGYGASLILIMAATIAQNVAT